MKLQLSFCFLSSTALSFICNEMHALKMDWLTLRSCSGAQSLVSRWIWVWEQHGDCTLWPHVHFQPQAEPSSLGYKWMSVHRLRKDHWTNPTFSNNLMSTSEANYNQWIYHESKEALEKLTDDPKLCIGVDGSPFILSNALIHARILKRETGKLQFPFAIL